MTVNLIEMENGTIIENRRIWGAG